MDQTARMKELIALLDEASRAYYQESREIMTNEHYDRLYDELQALEQETGTVLSNSPTHKVGYEVLSELPKEAHAAAALSLDKTKDVAVLQEFLGEQPGVLSWKLDGLTVVLTYENGELQKAVTRGNGEIGEVVTGNARRFVNLPLRIPSREHLVLRGEAVIRYPDFEAMNAEIPDDVKYKNPRNLCAGSVRQLDPSVTAGRHVHLIAFSLIEGEKSFKTMSEQLDFLDTLGFETVERVRVTRSSLPDAVKEFARRVTGYEVPSDGLVLVMDDIEYGKSLGRTAKFPRNALAFKWQDEKAETVLREIEWSASRTGLINPVAVFDPVELEGTTVSRASAHNISIMEELKLGIGDRLLVYKANMIIPQISEDLTGSGNFSVPVSCPVCGAPTETHDENGVKTLYCGNPRCPAKKIKAFDLFASRNALKMDGLSEATMEKLIDRGFLKSLPDLFRLKRFEAEIVAMEGFGKKSFDNMIASVEEARHTTLARLLYGLGIPGIGVAGGKLLASFFGNDINALRNASEEEIREIPEIGGVMAADIYAFFHNEEKMAELQELLRELVFEEKESTAEKTLQGITFVITGTVEHFENRDALKTYIEERGGRVSGSVSAKTGYLINNDVLSGSGKNKKAKELGVPVISEEDFLKMAANED